jgi:pyruvate dehydrogenase E2 component (dihydrolipoamide acetyltransferase)
MAVEILMPRLGWTMEEGIFGGWLKGDGEAVKTGELLFTIEGDKATQEVESFESGILHIPLNAPRPGDLLPVGARLAYLLRPGEALPVDQPAVAQSLVSSPESPVSNLQSPVSNLQSPIAMSPVASPRARRIARELGIDWTQLQGSGAGGRIVERDVRAAAERVAQATSAAPQRADEPKVRITPVAQRLAQQAGIDIAALAAQKGGERIERAEVEAAIAARGLPRPTAPVTPAEPLPPPPADAAVAVVPTSRIRRLIAQRMVESTQTTAPVTLTTEADATALVALREELKATLAPRQMVVPGYNDLLIKLTAVALQEHPALNATWHESEIHLFKAVHIGLAVDTAEGLLVPVLRHVERKSVRQIAAETRALIEGAQHRQLKPDALQGGTFTITNLGMYGVDAFTPILNLPQIAILGVGRIVKKPAVVDDQIVPRQMMTLSLTFDHRAVDGAPAARFLNTVREYIETPVLWLTA